MRYAWNAGSALVAGSVFLDRNAELIDPEFDAIRLELFAVDIDPKGDDCDQERADNHVKLILVHIPAAFAVPPRYAPARGKSSGGGPTPKSGIERRLPLAGLAAPRSELLQPRREFVPKALIGGAVGALADALIGRANEPGDCVYRDRYRRRYIDRCPERY